MRISNTEMDNNKKYNNENNLYAVQYSLSKYVTTQKVKCLNDK